MIAGADFDEAYQTTACNMKPPACDAPECFPASYPPISKPGVYGPFYINTSFLQPNRYAETIGTVAIRSEDFKCN